MGNRKPKDVFSYPQILFKIVEDVALRCKEVSIEVQSLSKARKLRGSFYAFRQGLSAAVQRGLAVAGSAESLQVDKLQNTLQFARTTVCWFDEAEAKKDSTRPVRVTFLNKDRTPLALALTEALEKAEGVVNQPPTQEDAAEAERTAAELARLVGEKDDKDNPYY